MEISKDIFRSYDIRGIYPTQLNEEISEVIGKALGTMLLEKRLKNIVVGRDNRKSSPDLCNRFTSGLLSTGCMVTDVGVTLTPIVHFLTCTQGFDAGINVTASHNPKEYNGFRMDYKNAGSIYGQDIEKIYEIVTSEDFIKGNGQLRKADLFPYYLNFLKKNFSFSRRIKIVIDCGSGASSDIAPKIFEALGCDVVPIYCHLDSSFPHGTPDPESPIFMAELKKSVLENKADVGLAFDTDGDRLGVVDETGVSYETDKLLLLFARDVLKQHPGGKVIYDVKSSQIVAATIVSLGGKPKMIRTGHPYFTQEMGNGAVLGAELSGHTYFSSPYFGYDDGIYAACKVLETMCTAGQALSGLMVKFPKRYHSNEIKINCPDNRKFSIIEEISVKISQEVKEISKIDGVRASVTETGWFLIRASNTSPYLSVRVEGASLEEAKFMLESVKIILEGYTFLEVAPLSDAKLNFS